MSLERDRRWLSTLRGQAHLRGNWTGTYLRGLSNAERLQSICDYIEIVHGWSMEEFIYYFAAAEAPHYAHTPNTAVKTLHKAIFEQPEVRKIVLDDDELIPEFLVKEISLKIQGKGFAS